MYLKKTMMRVSLILAFISFFAIGQNAWAAAISATASGNWNTGATWVGGVVPGPDDDVTIGAFTVTLDVNAEIQSLTLSAATSILRPADQATAVTLTVGGNITFGNAAAEVRVANNLGRMNLTINDASTITLLSNATGTVGLNVNNFTIQNAAVTYAGDFAMRVTGAMALTGTSSFTPAIVTEGTLTFAGGAAQTISVSDDSYCEFVNLNTAVASTAVTTTSDFTVREVITIAASTSLTASAGVATFNPSGASVLWTNGATLSLYDVLINTGTAAATPATNATITGDFTKIGGNNFAPTAGTVTFANTNPGGKNLQMVGGTNSFLNLAIASGATLTNTSDLSIGDPGLLTTAASITVLGTGSFIAQAGTITIISNAATIVNSATGTLTFNNLVNSATGIATGTASSFKITGNFTNASAGVFIATAGTITFENNIQKTITNTDDDETELMFWGLTIGTNSDVTSGDIFNIQSNLTLLAGSELTVTGGAGVETHFDVAGSLTITAASDANLEFSDVIIGATAATTVNTASSFTVNGTAFTLTDTGADFFNATGGTVTFTAACVLTAGTDGDLIFNNVLVDGAAVTDAAGDFVQIRGNLTINNSGASYTSGAASTVTFIGTTNSIISGDTDQDPVATFDVLVLNKTGATGSNLVQLSNNIEIANTATSTITLTDGYLNIGSTTLTVGANVLPTSTPGTSGINGGTGTYIVSTGHIATGLTDNLFTVSSVPTLFNLDVLVAHTLGAGDLTVNGDLDITAGVAFTIPAAQTLTLHGDFDNSGNGTVVGANGATSEWVFTGSGTANELEDATFGALMPSLTFLRGETLSGNLTLDAANILTINTSVSNVDIGANTLTFNNTSVLNLVSGSIKADAGSVVFGTHTSQTTIPANVFTNNIVNNLTIAAATTLGGDLTVNGTLAGLFQITTNNNTMTFGPSAVLPVYVAATHIVGNLRRTVTNTATVFPVGDGSAVTFRPIALQFETAGSEQIIKVSSALTNPTLNRGGDPTRAINALWTVTPEGTAPSDDLAIEFGWGANQNNGLAVGATTSFPAKWNSTSWADYRSNYGTVASANFVAASELTPTGGVFPVASSDLSGQWAVFVATAATDVAKDAAISTSDYKLAITNVSANPAEGGFPFAMTVQLQDQYGNPTVVPADGPYTVTFSNLIGTAASLPSGVILVGQSSATVNGFSYAANSTGNQILATVTAPAAPPRTIDPILPATSPVINVLGGLPGEQVSALTFANTTSTSTSLSFTLTSGDNAVILIKAGTAITEADFPVDGTTYYASNNFGQGSTIGDAVVVYKGLAAGTPITVNGLVPGTYYVRGFAYVGAPGAEKYIKFSAANNPRSLTVSGGIDDDLVFGPNNTRETAKPIGTNTPVQGTIKTATDVDWFSFAITNSSSNLRSLLTLTGITGNYNMELYNSDNRRIRRGTRVGNNNEAQVINDLPPGTYTVKIFGINGAFSSTNAYTLKLTTKGEEIFSVTP
ncbi:MAG: hypothetical protein KGZ71_05985 [Desulfobulbaceae bacterium]|nr:hypothetical protein [Candidatus Kapabacteria bacterium]MBS4000012.1 hypothetical protein [Desulfobulbaceae bacterium]